MLKFIIKKIKHSQPSNRYGFCASLAQKSSDDKEKHEKHKINNKKKIKDMDTKDKLSQIDTILNDETGVKVLKKDKSLIERTESSKIVLTEDNKELLND